jgi:dipeptidyl aminopeptidase/acylaminoacyl peptidase
VLPANPKHALPVAWSANVGDYATALALSSDGTLAAVGNAAGELWVFDASSGELRFRLNAHRGPIMAAAWSPKQRVVTTGGQDGVARSYDAQGGLIAELPGGAPWVEHVAWAPDGARLATGAGRVARLWTREGGALVESEPHESTLSGLAWNRQGTELATACYGGVRRFDVATGVAKHLPWPGSLISLSWSPNDAVIACGTQERSVHFWRLAKARQSEMSGFSAKPRALSWDGEGKLLATSGDAAVSVWSFEGKGPEGKPPIELVGHAALCTALAFHPKLARLASGAEDTGVLVWDPRRKTTPVAFGFLEETVTGLTWAQGGRLLIGADAAGRVTAWRADGLLLAT